MRYALAVVILVILTGCGSTSHPTIAAARVGEASIQRSDLQQYVDYTARFYAWLRHTPESAVRCHRRQSTPTCLHLYQQALTRLIQERVILSYAQRHGISLSPGDRVRIEIEMNRLHGDAANPTNVVRILGVSDAFMRRILSTELLVRKVESRLGPSSLRSGPSFHIRLYVVRYSSQTSRVQAQDDALTLATNGGPLPTGTVMRDEWVAQFHEPSGERELLAAAEPGQFVGPFPRNHSFLVVQLLERAVHRYGSPARQQLVSAYFHKWLRTQTSQANLTCFGVSGAPSRCPVVQ